MRKTFFVMLAVAVQGALCAASHLKVQYLDGSDYQAALSAIARLEITGEQMRLVGTGGEVLAEGNLFDDVRAVMLTDAPPASGLGEEALAGRIAVYPNPATERVTVSGLQAGETVRIFTTDGRLATTATADANGQAQVQARPLPGGTYLLQAGTQIVKVIKQ